MASMKKICLKANLEDEKSQIRIMKALAGIEGGMNLMTCSNQNIFSPFTIYVLTYECRQCSVSVESVAVDKEGKITVIGDADPVRLTVSLRKYGFAELVSIGPAEPEKFEAKKAEKEEGSNWDTENRGTNHYLGVQRAEAVGGFGGMNRAIEDNEGSKTRIVEAIVEAVAGFGNFSSIEVDIKKGMVTVVGKSVPVRVALKVREMGYRAKLLSLGPATEEEDPDEEDNEDLYPNHPSTTRNERYPYPVVTDEDYTTQGWNLTAILTVKEHFARIFLDVLGGIKNKVHKAFLLQKTPSQLPDELPRS